MSTVPGPLSPHLQIYKPQLTSLLSITHRATGVFLSLGAILLCYWLMAVAAGPATYGIAHKYINTWYGQLVLIAFVFSLNFHLCNGIRHLFWDMGMGLELKATYQSGYAVVAVSILLTGAVWIAGGVL